MTGEAEADIDRAFAHVVTELNDTPWMTPVQGRRIWDHFAQYRPMVALDLGTYLGASAAYLATAMRAFGIPGRVITVDSGQNIDNETIARWHDLWARCGVDDLIDDVLIDDSHYGWWLARQLEQALSAARDGQHARFDFVYLDGAKVLGIDAIAALFALDLLRAGGWLVLDDLKWSYHHAASIVSAPVTSYVDGGTFRFSDDEFHTSHIRLLYDLVLRRSPLVDETREDELCNWAWVRRRLGP